MEQTLYNQIEKLVYNNDRSGQSHKNTILKLSAGVEQSKLTTSNAIKKLISQKKLIRIEAKPVFFISCRYLQEKGIQVSKNSYASLEEVFQTADNDNSSDSLQHISKKAQRGFSSLIGSDDSLKKCIAQIQATLSYPPRGLPILLLGPTGCGKSLIARKSFEWAQDKGLIDKDKKFVTVNCSEYANNPELLTANLFGYVKGAFTGADKDNPGLAAAADGGILFLDEVHNLKSECQEKLFLLMDQGIYHPMGENEKWYTSKCRIMMATTEDPQKVLLKTLLRRVPVILHIPSLPARSLKERVDLVFSMYEMEQTQLNRKIQLSAAVYDLLVHAPVPGNLGGLKSAIQFSCINGLYEYPSGPILIQLHHLPSELLDIYVPSPALLSDQEGAVNHLPYIEIERDNQMAVSAHPLIQLGNFLLDRLGSADHSHKTSLNSLLESLSLRLIEELDLLEPVARQLPLYAFYEKSLQSLVEFLQSSHSTLSDVKTAKRISTMLCLTDQNQVLFRQWSLQRQDSMDEAEDLLMKICFQDWNLSAEICRWVQEHLEVEILSGFHSALTLLLHSANSSELPASCAVVLLGHGSGCATSMAQSANMILQGHIFDALDMPVYESYEDLLERLKNYLKYRLPLRQLYVGVDIGSLQNIARDIQIENCDIAVISGISLLCALELGSQIRSGRQMQQILEDLQSRNWVDYSYIPGQNKIPVLICSCASGEATARKLENIMSHSLPEESEVKLICLPFEELKSHKRKHPVFANYHVLGMLGTLNPEIEGLSYLGIEDLILNKAGITMDQWLNPYFEPDTLQIIKEKILQNFSLSSLMDELTILNPFQLLPQICHALDLFQKKLHTVFSVPTCFGLYIHISCMVERILLNHNAMEYPDTSDFEAHNSDFISRFYEAFADVQNHYRIHIHPAEIRLIQQYTIHDTDYEESEF